MKKNICENCGKEHDGSYGSGRFCSDLCRRKWSGKCNSRIIQEKIKRGDYVSNLLSTANSQHMRKKDGWKCRFCGLMFETKHALYEHYHLMHANQMCGPHGKGHACPFKGKTKETSASVLIAATKLKEQYQNGSIIPPFKGKHHSNNAKQKISEALRNADIRRVCKRTEPYTCVDGSIVNLDSSYERIVAKLLDEHKIKWNRPKPLIWIDKKNVQHHYFPDFYLVDYDMYLDPKNEYCFKVQKEKIDYIKVHYSNCFFLTNKQLTWKAINKIIGDVPKWL